MYTAAAPVPSAVLVLAPTLPGVTAVVTNNVAAPVDSPPTYDVLTVRHDGAQDVDLGSERGLRLGQRPVVSTEVEAVKKLLVSSRGEERAGGQPTGGGKAGRGSNKTGAAVGLPSGPVYGHSRQRAHQIMYDNSRLVARLVGAGNARNRAQTTSEAHDRHIANAEAGSLARRRQDEARLAADNLALYRRLQAVRPSKDVDSRLLGGDYGRSRGYLANLGAVPAAAPAAPGGGGRPEAWDERWQARPSAC